jgi:hypothetical protein
MSGASEVVLAAFDALDAGDHPGLVDLVDPEARERFKSAQVAQAEWRAQLPDDARPSGARSSFLRAVFAVQTVEELRTLDSAEVLRRWLRVARVRQEGPTVNRRLLGEVPESPSLVHVVFREESPAVPPPGLEALVPMSTVRVISAARGDSGWRVMLNGGIVYDDAGGWGIGYNDAVESE